MAGAGLWEDIERAMDDWHRWSVEDRIHTDLKNIQGSYNASYNNCTVSYDNRYYSNDLLTNLRIIDHRFPRSEPLGPPARKLSKYAGLSTTEQSRRRRADIVREAREAKEVPFTIAVVVGTIIGLCGVLECLSLLVTR